MSVELIATIQVFQGSKDDTKPVDAPVGSTFQEIDGIDWLKHEDQWVPAPNYLAIIAANTGNISRQMGRQHQDIGKLIAAVKRITKR